MDDKYCPSCDGALHFVGSVGVTVHEGLEFQADRYDCAESAGHSVLVINQIEDDEVETI